MSTPYQQGREAATKDIPAAANPFPKDSAEHESWDEGHRSVASALERSESEGT
jgi:hypothetical protein